MSLLVLFSIRIRAVGGDFPGENPTSLQSLDGPEGKHLGWVVN